MKMIFDKEAEGIAIKDLRRISRNMNRLFEFEVFLKKYGASLIDPKIGVLDYSKGVNPLHEKRRI